jgi:hypothetical protein
MALAFFNHGASAAPDLATSTDATSFATASHTPPTGLVIAFVNTRTANTDATSPPNIPTVTGNGLTWTQIATVAYNLSSSINRGRLSLFAANNTGGTGTAGATTFDFAGQTQTACQVSFFYVTGADLSGGTAAAFVQSPTNSGATLTTLSVTLAAAGHADNRPIAGFAHSANEVATERTNWTEVDERANSSPTTALETQYRSDAFETTASASWASNVACAGIAAEIKATVSGSVTLTADNGSFAENGQAALFRVSMTSNQGSFS